VAASDLPRASTRTGPCVRWHSLDLLISGQFMGRTYKIPVHPYLFVDKAALFVDKIDLFPGP